jgi:hypothetical protein
VDPAERDLLPDGRCCRSWSQLAIDARGGTPLLAWSSSVDPARAGLEVASLATGRVRYVPRSATPDRRDTVNGGIATSITGRISRPGVYVGYCEGFPRCVRGLVWRYGAPAPFVVVTGKGIRFLRVVAARSGRLWVMWYHGGLVWARRSNTAVTQFGGIVGAAVPGTARSTTWRLAGDASRGSLDAFAGVTASDGSSATWTTQLLPGMSITTRGRPARGSKITVRVEDAGVPLRGVTVTMRGVVARTNARGVAVVRVTGGAGIAVIGVAKAGYTPDSVRLPIH